MIRLTSAGGRHLFVSPEHITQVGSFNDRTYVTTSEHPDGPSGIVEDAFDVARLKAAWELRHHAEELRGELIVAVYMDRDDPEEPKIQFLCCAITRKLRDEREAVLKKTRDAIRSVGKPQDEQPTFEGLFSEIFGHAFPNDSDKR